MKLNRLLTDHRLLDADRVFAAGLMTLSRDGAQELPVPFAVRRDTVGTTLCIRAGQLVDGYLNGIGRKLEIRDPQYAGDGQAILADFSSATIREGEFFSDALWSFGRFFDSESNQSGIGLYVAGQLHGRGRAGKPFKEKLTYKEGFYDRGEHKAAVPEYGVDAVRAQERDWDSFSQQQQI